MAGDHANAVISNFIKSVITTLHMWRCIPADHFSVYNYKNQKR
jgi:hypothetical protein